MNYTVARCTQLCAVTRTPNMFLELEIPVSKCLPHSSVTYRKLLRP
jgi:hypothetical protein